MYLGMAWTAQRHQVCRIFIEDPDIGPVVNYGRRSFAALLAEKVGTF
jgi:hypothetical protein